MKKKLEEFFKLSNEDILMIVLAFMAFSIGIWGNYRQLWLENFGFTIGEISRIFSVALICSAVIAFIISFFSSKISYKNLILESMFLRSISMAVLFINPSAFTAKTCILLGIMCDVIFTISFFPLLNLVNKSDETYRKKVFIEYISKDAGIISCGLLIGVSVGRIIFDYNSCLIIALVTGMISAVFLLLYNGETKPKDSKTSSLKSSIKRIFKNKKSNYFLSSQFVTNVSYGIVFDLMMLILTGYIKFEVSFASIFIIVINLLGSIGCSYYNKHGKKYSIKKSVFIKFGSRAIAYLLAALTNNIVVFILSIVIAYVTSRILEDKVTGSFLKIIGKSDYFLYENIRYFIICVGEGVGAFFAGILLGISLRALFLGAGIVTMIQIMLLIQADTVKENN